MNGRMDWVMLDSAVSQAFKVRNPHSLQPVKKLNANLKHAYNYNSAVTLTLASRGASGVLFRGVK